MLTIAIVIVACAALNRAAGLDLPKGWHGRPLWYATPILGLLALATNPLPVASAWAAGYLFWRTWPWGRWYSLGLDPNARAGEKPDWFEATVEALSDGSKAISMFWRYLMVWPGLALVGFVGPHHWLVFMGPIVAFGFLGCLYAGKRLYPLYIIPVADVLIGALWGVMIALL